MDVQKITYWKIGIPESIFDTYWGCRAIEEAFGISVTNLESSLFFSSRAAAITGAREFLNTWNKYSTEILGDETRIVSEDIVVTPDEVTLVLRMEVRPKEVKNIYKKVVVDGEEYSKVVQETVWGEWKAEEEQTTVYVYQKQIVVMGA
jgi:hypothetical protein